MKLCIQFKEPGRRNPGLPLKSSTLSCDTCLNRGNYKPLGVSGEALRNALLVLRPEIYGSIAEEERVELDGLLYVAERLPKGIEECRYVRFISKEGFSHSHFDVIIPQKRRRNCYRIDAEQMYIQLIRGRSDIYDVLTHLTFMYIEAEKIRRNSLDAKNLIKREWVKLEELVLQQEAGEDVNDEIAFTYLSTILGRTYEETEVAYKKFAHSPTSNNSLLHFTYWMGKLAIEEYREEKDREISFSSALRDRIGHHIYGEEWASAIKEYLLESQLMQRPVHIISANLHSIMNCLYAPAALGKAAKAESLEDMAKVLSQLENAHLREKVKSYASRNGMHQMHDHSGTGISVQIIDTAAVDFSLLSQEIAYDTDFIADTQPVLLVMDYPFGEQGFEIMDELLKPLDLEGTEVHLNVASISIMGKAGILKGNKGDIMIPTAHVFEGTADNYPFKNELTAADFKGCGLQVFEGPMITVLGTSLQNKDVLRYFLNSSWGAIGLEMEGAHLQKAIQSASKIRNSISEDVVLRYAYYASDNPLITGHTLASGSLGLEGVKPTYLITTNILKKILMPAKDIKKAEV